ncbi:2-keto-4-pentenoate hydratase [Aromatoleum sp.]|uniref:2-keto-4-pentenoate hydratase n=1 Tax=Aromatoleum sp. TaxID=2307007 RepID=UPI002FC9EF9E
MRSMSVLSTALVDAWRSGQPLNAEAATHLAPPDEAAAYRVQREVADALGWYASGRPRAWKMGAASRDATPTAAPIPDPALIDSPAHLAATSAHTLIGVEVELAVRLARPLLPGASAEDARAAVAEVLAAIEICDVRAHDWRILPPLFRLADQQMNRWLILGNGVSGPWRDAFAACEVRLEINGVETLRRHGGHPLGEPLFVLPWLAGHAAREYAGRLRAGDLITTGTWTGLYEAKPGDRVRASFAGIGSVEVEIGRT